MNLKILIIRFSSIGDIVLTSPVVRCLKKQLAHAEIHFLTKEKHADLLFANPYIDKIHLLKAKLSDILPQLQNENFDYVIDLHHNIRSQYIKQNLKSKNFTFKKLNIKKWLLVKFKINTMPQVHIVDRMMDAVIPLGIKNDAQGLDYFIPENELIECNTLPLDFQTGFVAIVLAGTYHTKRLPAEKQIEFISKTDIPFILLGGESEEELAKQIEEQATGKILNLCNKLSINQSASIVKQAKLIVANDTGLMHIAAAFKKKILSIWGSTTPDLGMTPYLSHQDSSFQQVIGLSCQPCSKIGRHQCPKKHFRCMLEQDTTKMSSWITKHY